MKRFPPLPLVCSSLFLSCSHGIHGPDNDKIDMAVMELKRLNERPKTGPGCITTLPIRPHPLPTRSADPATLIVPPSEMSKARDLVKRLGHEDYEEREIAYKTIAKMGRCAAPALRHAVRTDPSAEVRYRCTQLLPKATRDEIGARLDVFAADAEARYVHDVPGIKTFRKLLGYSEGMRALTVAVLSDPDNRELFAAIEEGYAKGEQAMINRRRALYQAMQPRNGMGGKGRQLQEPSLEQIAAILVAELAISSVEQPRGSESPWVTGGDFLWATPTHHAMAGLGLHAEAYKEILAKWIATRRTPAELEHITSPLQHIFVGFKETFPALSRVVKTPGVAVRSKCEALSALALATLYKNKVQPILISILTDDSVVQLVRLPGLDGTYEILPCRLQDVALAFLLQINNQDVESYGFEYDPIYGPRRFATDRSFIGNAGYAFRTDQRRKAAMMRFAWWQFKHASR